jgi:hypothetical protein
VLNLIDNTINGGYIAVLEYGVMVGLHAHILCGKQNNRLLKSEFLVTDSEFSNTVSYLSKPIITPVKLGKFRGNYPMMRESYEIICGEIIQRRRKKRQRCRQVVYRINKKTNSLHSPFSRGCI